MDTAPTTIPRATVAAALELPEDTDALPAGDLPIERFAARFLAALQTEDVTDGWTVDLFHHLVTAAPKLALATILAGLHQAPDRAEDLGEGPLSDLLARSGADVMTGIEAVEDPCLTRAMQAVDADQIEHPLLRARIEAVRLQS